MTPPDLDRLLEHSQWLRPMARSLVRDEHLAEDVVQETYLAAVKKPPKDAPLGAWMAHVLRNAVRMHARKEGRRVAREEKVARPEGLHPRTDEQLELRMDMVHALLDLREPYRSTLILRFYDDLTPQEIADQEGVPAATVRGRLKRGLDTLRERFEKRGKAGLLALLLIADLPGVDAATLWEEVETVHPDGTLVLAGTGGPPWLAVVAPILLVVVFLAVRSGAAHERDSRGSTPPEGRTTSAPLLGDANHASSGDREVASTAQPTNEVRTLAPQIVRTEEKRPAPLEDPVTLRVVDRTGSGVSGAQVHHGIRRLEGTQIAAGFATTIEFLLHDATPHFLGRTDANGVLGVERAILRSDPITVHAPGFRTTFEGVAVRALDGDRHTITLDAPIGSTLELRSVDGGMIEDARITITEGGPGPARTFEAPPRDSGTGRDVWRTTIALEGRVPLATVHAPGYASSQELLGAPEHTIELVPGTTAHGTVLDPTGMPLAGARVAVRSETWSGPPAVTTTAADGTFETIALPFPPSDDLGMKEVTVTIEVTHPDHPRLTTNAHLADSSRDLGVFALTEGHPMAVTARDNDGAPLVGARVQVLPSGEAPRTRDALFATTDLRGIAEFPPLVAETFIVRAEAQGYSPATLVVGPTTSNSAPAGPIEIALTPEHVVTGIVRNTAGDPVVGVPVRIGAIVGDELRGEIAVTDDAGQFTIGGLPGVTIRHTPRRRVLRWTALPASDLSVAIDAAPAAAEAASEFALLELFLPHQLVAVDGIAVEQRAHFGSRNTAAIHLPTFAVERGWTGSAEAIELIVEPIEALPPITFSIVDADGVPVLAHTNLHIASPDEWVMKDFAGLDGRPLHLPDPWVLDDAQVTVMSRGYPWRTVRLDLRGNLGVVRFELPRPLSDPPQLAVEPAGAREILVAPLIDGRPPIAALPVGRSAEDGTIALPMLGPGVYQVCVPGPGETVFRSDGVRRRISMEIGEVRVIGVIEITGGEGERMRLEDLGG